MPLFFTILSIVSLNFHSNNIIYIDHSIVRESEKMHFINDITAMSYQEPIEKDKKLYTEIYFPYFRYSEQYQNALENPNIWPREKIYYAIKKHPNNVLTFHFADRYINDEPTSYQREQ